MVDIDNLKSLIKETTILVSINSVNSEIGLRQPIEEIGKLLKEYPKIFFHVDMTQSIGKINIPLDNVDFPPWINGSRFIPSFFIRHPIPFIPYILCADILAKSISVKSTGILPNAWVQSTWKKHFG